jgi:hypothetical protein
MFEGVGLVVPLEISLQDRSKFSFLFSVIVYSFSLFCILIGILVRVVSITRHFFCALFQVSVLN